MPGRALVLLGAGDRRRSGAAIEEPGELSLLHRRDGDPRLRAAGAEFWLDDDPIQPPLV